jgi:hypothetical protein
MHAGVLFRRIIPREGSMRIVIAIAAASLAGALVGTQPAKAEITYAWCAVYSELDASRNCGFATYEQCRAAVSGNGGFCEPNSMYQPGAGSKARRPAR